MFESKWIYSPKEYFQVNMNKYEYCKQTFIFMEIKIFEIKF